MAPRCDARATAARSWRRAKLPHMPRCDPGALATRHGASGALPAPGRGTRADRTLRAPAKSAARSGARGFARRAARTARTRGPVRARLQRALSMPSRCTWPTPAHAASGNTPCQARKTRSSHGSTVEPEIRNGKADPLQAMRQRKACSSAANAPSARDPANTAALHPPASSMADSPVSFGTSARAHTPTGGPHERTGSARPCAFRQNPGAPHQCRVNVVPARPESAVPGPRSAPQNAQSANRGRNPRGRLQTGQRPRARANADNSPVSRQNRQPASSGACMDHHGFSRPISERSIHALSRHTRRPMERPTNLRRRLDEPRKIPNLQIKIRTARK